MDFASLLRLVESRDASDLFLCAGTAPTIKVKQELHPLSTHHLSSDQVEHILQLIASPQQLSQFNQTAELNFAFEHNPTSRYRISAFRQRNLPAIILRRIDPIIPSTEQLQLKAIYSDLALQRQGLVLIVGSTGSGKSTSLAAMIHHRNQQQRGHIISVEDPIEFIHPSEKSIVSQREVGQDTQSYEIALKNALRQAPDMIVIGEIRDRASMQLALQAARTGHLCIATLHANNCQQALERIPLFFDPGERESVLFDLSNSLKALIAQRLIPVYKQKQQQLINEIVLNTSLVSSLIRNQNLGQIKTVIEKSKPLGMLSFEDELYNLVTQKQILADHALKLADHETELRLKLKLNGFLETCTSTPELKIDFSEPQKKAS
ncbi:MAG: PilT/PilU family type 4a pilus ATPase [Gammaproteobacteria bacterium]|nr:PilT/PilU family type 4a pilus ATPase [Gammaproteobacteria bacterium]